MSTDDYRWDNPVFHEGRRWGRMEEQARIVDVLKKNIQDDDGEGLSQRDQDGMGLVLNMNALISLIGGSDES